MSPEYSGLMLKLKLQCFGHLMQRVDSLEKSLMLGKIEGRRRRGQQRVRWLVGITDSRDMNLSKLQESEGQGSLACCSPWGRIESNTIKWLNNKKRLDQWCGLQDNTSDSPIWFSCIPEARYHWGPHFADSHLCSVYKSLSVLFSTNFQVYLLLLLLLLLSHFSRVRLCAAP